VNDSECLLYSSFPLALPVVEIKGEFGFLPSVSAGSASITLPSSIYHMLFFVTIFHYII
jgi:hypothetical protein